MLSDPITVRGSAHPSPHRYIPEEKGADNQDPGNTEAVTQLKSHTLDSKEAGQQYTIAQVDARSGEAHQQLHTVGLLLPLPLAFDNDLSPHDNLGPHGITDRQPASMQAMKGKKQSSEGAVAGYSHRHA